MNDIPAVIYMQGVLRSIARHHTAGMSRKELRESITVRDFLKCDWILRQQAKFGKRAIMEAEMIRMSGNVIVENEWCAAQSRAVYQGCRTHQCELNIRDEFFAHQWSPETMEPMRIMSIAAAFPFKGLHMLIKALSLVVRTHPTATVAIPGQQSPFENNWKQSLRENGYSKYIRSLITRHGLTHNIVFLGHLSPQQMAQQMAKAHVFVVPSSIENHSSSLIEAMIVGTPCIASYVGGIPESITHNENGLLYRFDDYEMLASHLCTIFRDNAFACRLASNGTRSMRSVRSSAAITGKLLDIYTSLAHNGTQSAELY